MHAFWTLFFPFIVSSQWCLFGEITFALNWQPLKKSCGHGGRRGRGGRGRRRRRGGARARALGAMAVAGAGAGVGAEVSTSTVADACEGAVAGATRGGGHGTLAPEREKGREGPYKTELGANNHGAQIHGAELGAKIHGVELGTMSGSTPPMWP